MNESKITDPGCAGVLILVAPLIAGAISDTLVFPTFVLTVVGILIAAIVPKVPWKRLALPTVVATLIIGFLAIPVVTGMRPEESARYYAYALLLGLVWLVYWAVKSMFGG